LAELNKEILLGFTGWLMANALDGYLIFAGLMGCLWLPFNVGLVFVPLGWGSDDAARGLNKPPLKAELEAAMRRGVATHFIPSARSKRAFPRSEHRVYPMAPPPMPRQAKKRLTLALAALFIMALLGLYRAQPGYSGVWTVTGPGLSITVLRDIHRGPVLWLYLDGEFLDRWPLGRPGRWLYLDGEVLDRWQMGGPPAYPTVPPPDPTSTPSPGPDRRMPLKNV
jgi:hypothetical protein